MRSKVFHVAYLIEQAVRQIIFLLFDEKRICHLSVFVFVRIALPGGAFGRFRGTLVFWGLFYEWRALKTGDQHGNSSNSIINRKLVNERIIAGWSKNNHPNHYIISDDSLIYSGRCQRGTLVEPWTLHSINYPSSWMLSDFCHLPY